MANLNSDGSIAINGVVLTAAQVREIKEAKPLPAKQTGYWICYYGKPYSFLGNKLNIAENSCIEKTSGLHFKSETTDRAQVVAWSITFGTY